MDRRTVAVAGHTDDRAVAQAGLSHADGAVRASALGALERLGALTDGALGTGLEDQDPRVRRRACELAARHSGVSLLPALGDADPAVVEAAAWACGERETVSDEILDALIALALGAGDAGHAGHEPLVRESAVAALGAIGDDRGVDAILAGTVDKPAIRRRAVLAMAPFVGPDHPRAVDVQTALQRALTDHDWQVRQAAEDLTNANCP